MVTAVQHRLFLGLPPPAPVIPEMARLRDAFPSRRPVSDGQLHMTLLPFPLSPEFPRALEGQLIRLISAAALPCCRVIVDRLVLGHRSALLQPSEPVVALQSLQRMLARLLLPRRFEASAARRFSPHFTLFYDGPTRASLCIDPISWTAEELVLVHSLHGQGRHETLARWPLRS